jgi:D-beta-D-heptose 7-phosphate kinase/D-beta-D-heptose 1-phosphate adenosyltransferase
LGRVVSQEELIVVVAEAKRNARRVVFTNGCFDLLHPGHTRLLEASRALGDLLVVGLNSDSSVRRLKGEARPVMLQSERAELLAALASVDFVSIFEEDTPLEIIRRVRPDVLVKGADWGPDEIVGREIVGAEGGRVVSIPLYKGYSTSSLIASMRALPAAAQK